MHWELKAEQEAANFPLLTLSSWAASCRGGRESGGISAKPHHFLAQCDVSVQVFQRLSRISLI